MGVLDSRSKPNSGGENEGEVDTTPLSKEPLKPRKRNSKKHKGNIRGIGTDASLLYLKDIIRLHNPSVIAILEPKQQASNIADYARKIKYEGFFQGDPINTHS